MSLDINNLKIIDASEVPAGMRRTKWDEVFDVIKEGKALVLDPTKVSHTSVRQALRKRQEKGLYKNYYVSMKGPKGAKKIYVVHNQRE